MSEENVMLVIDNVRIRRFNSMNYVVERHEDVYIPKSKKVEKRWVFHGYQSTIFKALGLINSKELLVNETSVSDLKSYLKHIYDSNAKLLKAVRE